MLSHAALEAVAVRDCEQAGAHTARDEIRAVVSRIRALRSGRE
jgi:hypothetical protein